MGCYSFVCKGCGGELCENELVRMDGSTQNYNGYGGSVGGEGGACWHELCYQEATDAQKLDDDPSGHAPDQGFGPPKLEFLSGYDPSKSFTISAVIVDAGISITNGDDFTYQNFSFYLTDKGLLDQCAWQTKLDELDEAAYQKAYHGGLAEDEKATCYEKEVLDIKSKIGPSPEKQARTFDTLEQALETLEPLLPKLQEQNEQFKTYSFRILGEQDVVPVVGDFVEEIAKVQTIEGAVYDLNHYPIEDEKFQPTDEWEIKVLYDIRARVVAPVKPMPEKVEHRGQAYRAVKPLPPELRERAEKGRHTIAGELIGLLLDHIDLNEKDQ